MASGAQIIQLPVTEKLCATCINAYLGVTGVYCREFNEDIWNERVAAECEQYEEQ